jgi:putative SOS response-associated peptidase YedK
MCGRYSLVCIDDLGNRFRVFDPMIGIRSRFNIAPGSEVPVIIHTGTNRMVMMEWGLVPHRIRDMKSARPVINARAETLSEKPMFSPLLKARRCLVPASGFFEWKNEGSEKVPYYIRIAYEPLFSFAGLYDEWHAPDGTSRYRFTIITTGPNEQMAPIHNRQPAILRPEDEERWLDPEPYNFGLLRTVLAPFPSGSMIIDPVSLLVNNPAIDDERVIRPVHMRDRPTTLDV